MGHYQASCLEAGTEPTIHTASFEIQAASAFDVAYNTWLPDEKEAKVRFACLESLGHMCLLLDRPALEARLPKLIPSYLMMYKKEKPQDHLAISHVSPVAVRCSATHGRTDSGAEEIAAAGVRRRTAPCWAAHNKHSLGLFRSILSHRVCAAR